MYRTTTHRFHTTGIKNGVRNWMRQNTNIQDDWPWNYNEHIILSSQAYWAISNYILSNPKNWERDRFHRR